MRTPARILIGAAVGLAVLAAIALKQPQPPAQPKNEAPAPASGSLESSPKPAVPSLVDVGARRCIPCKMMAPILEELRREYAGRMEVKFVDVLENPDAAKLYAVEIIPTQIFFDATGKELFRHVGFFAKDDILAKWKELGVNLGEAKAGSEQGES